MSNILCEWLNRELRLSKDVEPKTFAKDFSTGYLFGEVLHKYKMQNDFNLFINKDTSLSKLNNFTRLEPTLQLLGITYTISTAHELMQEKPGIATNLLYQLYITLEKNRAEMSCTMMQIPQPAAGQQKKQLHPVVRRDAELKLQNISQGYEVTLQQPSNVSVMTDPIQQKSPVEVQDEKETTNIEKPQMSRQKHSGIRPFKKSTSVKLHKPQAYALQLDLKKMQQQRQRREQQAQTVQTEIADFETKKGKVVSSGLASSSSGQSMPGPVPIGGSSHGFEVHGGGTKLILQSSSKYMQEIRQRLEDNAIAREQREKRRDRFLMEQLKAHESQEEARREEQLVKRLTRQTQQEQRLVSQILQIRMEKEVIRQNRLFREQQYQQQRERDFRMALDRAAALARQAKLSRAKDIRKELEFLKRIAAERAKIRYEKHYETCKAISEHIVDLATKIGEYRQITANLIPEKLMREWKELLLSGLPLYDPIEHQQPEDEYSASTDPVELKRQEILNNQDYDEYNNMVGEWTWQEEAGETKCPPTNNNVVGHVILRLKKLILPPTKEPASRALPYYTLQACVLGKFCSGKTTCLAKIAKAHDICILSADILVEEALSAYRDGEVTEQQDTKDTSTSPESEPKMKEENTDSSLSVMQPSTRAVQGAAVEKELKQGDGISNELLVDIILEAIRRVPAKSGWILDGFPVDITQAHLLEKALGGSVDEGDGEESGRENLAVDPDPPKPVPPPDPVLNLALLLDIPDETVTTRAFSHGDTDADTSDDTIAQATDKNMYLAQIPHRITAFQDTWPTLEEWFGGKQNILVCVDANVVEKKLYSKVESVLKRLLMKKRQTLKNKSENKKTPVSSSAATSPPVDQPPPTTDEAPCPTEPEPSLNKKKGQSSKASASSVINDDSRGVAEIPPVSVSPCPFTASWVYVEEPLPKEISQNLCTHWEAVCESYVNNIKTVMQQLRSQGDVIRHHLFNIREEYKHYLDRPDMKQELVSQWQKDFNSISDDMRADGDTKAELHLRLDELRERLWDIGDKRKEQDEQEKASVMYGGWLEDHTAVLVNHHTSLTQVELERFQGTLCFLRVYYMTMFTKELPEPPANLLYIPLLDNPELKDQTDSAEPAETGLSSQLDDTEERIKTKLVALVPKCPDSSGGTAKAHGHGHGHAEPVKTPHEKLLSDYEEARQAMSKLVSAESHQGETKEQKEKPKEKQKTPASAGKKKKGKQAGKKQKGPTTTVPEPTPTPAEDKNETSDQEIKKKIIKEYMAALHHEEKAAKERIALVKSHGLLTVEELQSRAQQACSDMEKWLEAHYLAEMKSIDQFSEVVCHHIEAGDKLQNELVLGCTGFYLNGDCLMMTCQTPPPSPPPQEKSKLSTPTISQLESLYQQLYNIAPSGFMSSLEFSNLLRDVTSVNMGRNVLPDSWININEKQMMDIVSLLVDHRELVDWRQFLLSAALPWPFPSLTQLLVVLRRFKGADTGSTGHINREQYLQTELWFSNESDQPVPEHTAEPLPYDRMSNLHKFFFQLFADHSFSPAQLDYVSMLLYFAADPDPRQGFIRALSVVLGQHLKLSTLGHLVRSMPSMEDDAELSLSELDGEYKESLIGSGSSLEDQEVSVLALLDVICRKGPKVIDGNPPPPGCLNQEEHTQYLVHIFTELGFMPENGVPFSILSQHPFIQGLMENSTQYRLVNLHGVILAGQGEEA